MNKVFNFENVAVGRALKMMNKTVRMMDLVFSFETEWCHWRQDSVDCELVFNFGNVAVGNTLKMLIRTAWMVVFETIVEQDVQIRNFRSATWLHNDRLPVPLLRQLLGADHKHGC